MTKKPKCFMKNFEQKTVFQIVFLNLKISNISLTSLILFYIKYVH